jgi:LPXTG-motif cell wall-anchored protein
VTKWVAGRQRPVVSHGKYDFTAWSRGKALRGLLVLLGTMLLLVALSLAGSGSVVLAASAEQAAAPSPVMPPVAASETLLYALFGIVMIGLGWIAGRRRRQSS